MEFFDAHAHYDDIRFKEDRKELISKIHEFGVTMIVSAGYSLQSTKNNLELTTKYDYIYTTAGISPNDLHENWESDVVCIDKIIYDNLYSGRIVAVGEIGFDYHYDVDKKIQYEAFKSQIDIANKYDLPIVIHTREAVVDTINMLKTNVVNKKGIFHCCPLNRELVKEALKLGFYISIAGPITFKNSKNANEIIDMIPIDRILIETDSPYLAPDPVRGTRNDSRNLKYIAEKIADVKNKDLEYITKVTYENAKRIYNIK